MDGSEAQSGQPPGGKPRVTPEQGIEILIGQLRQAEELLEELRAPGPSWRFNDYKSWNSYTRTTLEEAFGEGHGNVKEFEESGSKQDRSDPCIKALKAQIAELNRFIRQLMKARTQQQSVTAGSSLTREGSKKVFIVHGHNDTLKYEIAHSLQKAGLDVTILHEEANKGRTILEKFSEHAAEVGFAIVLLTADDEGRTKDSLLAGLQARARQNVVFELGFFFGRLGRGRVCAVLESGVEIPSDLHGLVYVKHDSTGRWKTDVAKEIHATGINVDFSKL
jgi:predicted nucleotide-binding protein